MTTRMRHVLVLLALMLCCGCACGSSSHENGNTYPGVGGFVDVPYKSGKPGGNTPAENYNLHPGVDGVPDKAAFEKLAGILKINREAIPPLTQSVPASSPVDGDPAATGSHPAPVVTLTCKGRREHADEVTGGIPGVNSVPCVAGVPGTADVQEVIRVPGTSGDTRVRGAADSTHPAPGVVPNPKDAKSPNLIIRSQPDAGVGGLTSVDGTQSIGADRQPGVSINDTKDPETPAVIPDVSKTHPGPRIPVEANLTDSLNLTIRSQRDDNAGVTSDNGAQSVDDVESNAQVSGPASTQHGENDNQAENTGASSTTGGINVAGANGVRPSSQTPTSPAQSESTMATPNTPSNGEPPSTTTATATVPPVSAHSNTHKKPSGKGDANSSSISSVWVSVPLLIVVALFSTLVC